MLKKISYSATLLLLVLLCPFSLNAQNKLSSVQLVGFHKSSCSYVGYGEEQVLHTHLHQDTLFIRIQTHKNCNLEILDLEALWSWKQDTLRLDFEVLMPKADPNSDLPPEPIPEMECDCLFWLDYSFYYPNKTPLPPLTFEQKVLPHYKGFDFFEDEKINVLDTLGRRQGKWSYDFRYWETPDQFYYYRNDTLIKSEVFYFDALFKKNKNGRLINYKRTARIENYLSGKGTTIEYHENGKEKSRKHYTLKRNASKSK